MPETEILKLSGLSKTYAKSGFGRKTKLKAVDSITLSVGKGEIFGIVGESGCGKSTVAKMIAHLLEPTSGGIHLHGEPVKLTNRAAMMWYRRDVQMVFQDPYSSINPRTTVRRAVLAPLKSLFRYSQAEMDGKFAEMMESVGIPERLFDKRPHELSGGQLQRVAIARALIGDPSLLIADEPIAALDVSIQAQILNLLLNLQKKTGLTIVFISHDLRVVSQFTDRLAIMYLGNIVETGTTADIFRHPRHPYTRALIRSIPAIDHSQRKPLEALEGEVPSLFHMPQGCPFHPRCAQKSDRCLAEKPPLAGTGSEDAAHRQVACFHPLVDAEEPAVHSDALPAGASRNSSPASEPNRKGETLP